VKKYAEPSVSVQISVSANDENAIISMKNSVKPNPDGESNGIGLKTVKIILEQNGGKLYHDIKDDIFEALVLLPLK
jgi:two-component sensor histidine kinase